MLIRGIVLFLSLNAATDQKLTLPEKPTQHVNDYAQVLTPDHVAKLEARIKSYEQSPSGPVPQVAVAVFQSLDGEDLEDFSIRLAEKWKIGRRGRDDGVIVVVFIGDRKMRIEVGYGLEGKLTDAICSRIIREDIGPYFKRSEYAAGLAAGIDRIFQVLQIAPAPGSGVEAPAPLPRESALNWLSLLFPFGVLLFVIIFLSIARRGGYTASGSGWSSGGWGGGGGWSSGGGGGFSGGGGSFGGGGSSGSW